MKVAAFALAFTLALAACATGAATLKTCQPEESFPCPSHELLCVTETTLPERSTCSCALRPAIPLAKPKCSPPLTADERLTCP